MMVVVCTEVFGRGKNCDHSLCDHSQIDRQTIQLLLRDRSTLLYVPAITFRTYLLERAKRRQ